MPLSFIELLTKEIQTELEAVYEISPDKYDSINASDLNNITISNPKIQPDISEIATTPFFRDFEGSKEFRINPKVVSDVVEQMHDKLNQYLCKVVNESYAKSTPKKSIKKLGLTLYGNTYYAHGNNAEDYEDLYRIKFYILHKMQVEHSENIEVETRTQSLSPFIPNEAFYFLTLPMELVQAAMEGKAPLPQGKHTTTAEMLKQQPASAAKKYPGEVDVKSKIDTKAQVASVHTPRETDPLLPHHDEEEPCCTCTML